MINSHNTTYQPLTQAMFKDIRDLTKEYFHLADRALKLDELYPCADESLLRVVRYCELLASSTSMHRLYPDFLPGPAKSWTRILS